MKRVVDIGDLADRDKRDPHVRTVRRSVTKRRRTAARAHDPHDDGIPMYGIGYVPASALRAADDTTNLGDAHEPSTEGGSDARMWWAVFGVSAVVAVGVDIYFRVRRPRRKGA